MPRYILLFVLIAATTAIVGGLLLLAGTDTGNPFVVPGASLHEELGLPRATWRPWEP